MQKIKFWEFKVFTVENEKISINQELKNFISDKKIWCASSTHDSEEKFCGTVHQKLKLKYKNLVTIIIPRHIDRINDIKDQLERMNLKVHVHKPENKIKNEIDIYLVNSYGTTKRFTQFVEMFFRRFTDKSWRTKSFRSC